MNQYLMEGRYYQFVGRIREWIGTVAHNELEVDLDRADQLVGRITERCQVSLKEAELRANEVVQHNPSGAAFQECMTRSKQLYR